MTEEMIEVALAPEEAPAAGGESGSASAPADDASRRAERFVALAERQRRLNQEHGGGASGLEAQLGGEEDERAVARLMELGYAKENCEAALVGAGGDIKAATEVLLQTS